MEQQAFTQEPRIDLLDIIKTVFRYKLSIFLITIFVTIGSIIYSFTKQEVYISDINIELVEEDNKKAGTEDFLLRALQGNTVNVDNQIEIFKSSFLIKKVFELLDLEVSYFTIANYKKIDLYKTSPFVVQNLFIDELLYDREFIITPIDDENFNLQIKKPSKYSPKSILKEFEIIPYLKEEKITYNKNHKYGEKISSQWFEFIIKTVHTPVNNKYSFSITNENSFLETFKENISVSQTSKKATVLNISYRSTSAEKSKDILNTLYQAYTQDEIERKVGSSELTIGFIDKQLDSITNRLNKSSKNLVDFKEENKVVGINVQARSTSENMNKYQSQLEEIQTEINILSNLQTYINSNQDLTGMTVGVGSFADPVLGSLIRKLQDQASLRGQLLSDFTELHPDVVKVNIDISNLKRSIKTAIRNNLRQLKQRRASTLGIINKIEKTILTMPKQETELSKLTRHYKIDEDIYSFLLKKKAETAILKSSTVSKSRILDPAKEGTQIEPNKKVIILVGFIIGLIIGIIFAYLKEFIQNTIKSLEDIEKLTTIPLYGIIPEKKGKKSLSIFHESFINLRTNLQFLPHAKDCKVIALTSSISGEGKTTISANLAKILGDGNEKVIILDTDLRKSSVHREFNINNINGLSNYLSGHKSKEEIIQKTKSVNVDLITTGPLPPNPSQLLLGDKFTNLVEELKKDYDYIIIDTPPIGIVADALILMNYVDMTFVINRVNVTRKEFVKNVDRLAKEHAHNNIGMILNGGEIGSKNSYGYGTSYGYEYGKKYY